MPDGAGGLVIKAFAPNDMSFIAAIDRHPKIIAEWEAETFRLDVTIACHVAGDTNLVSPCRSAVARTAVVGIPVGRVARIHPRNSHVAGASRHDRRKCMLD